MSSFRWEIEASAGPARERLIDGRAALLVRVRLFDPPGTLDEHGRPTSKPDAFTDLRTDDAPGLTAGLLLIADCGSGASGRGECRPRNTQRSAGLPKGPKCRKLRKSF